MTELFNFLKEYGVYILTFACFVIELVFIFIKRKPKTVDDFLYCLNEIRTLVPLYVSDVEVPGNGDIKKSTVIQVLTSLFEKKLGRKITDRECVILTEFLDKDIEAVLTAPTKKGVNYEK